MKNYTMKIDVDPFEVTGEMDTEDLIAILLLREDRVKAARVICQDAYAKVEQEEILTRARNHFDRGRGYAREFIADLLGMGHFVSDDQLIDELRRRF